MRSAISMTMTPLLLYFRTRGKTSEDPVASVLQNILHIVLLIAEVKISRYCSIINLIQDY